MRRIRRWLVLLAFLNIGAGSALLFASPAGATTATYSDPRPCSPTVQKGVCISQVSADYTTTTISLSMTVGKATDPTSDPNWTNSAVTSDGWGITVDGASSPSYLASADDLTGSYQGAIVNDSDLSTACNGTSGVSVTFDVSANTYGISFPASCIGTPTSVMVQAFWMYDTSGGTGGTVLSYDSPANNGEQLGSCCNVTPDTTTPTTSPTTTPTTAPTTMSPTTTPTTAPTTTTTAAIATAANSGSTSTGTLAFTGPGEGLRWTALLGGAFLLFGFGLFAIADTPHRLRLQLAGWGRGVQARRRIQPPRKPGVSKDGVVW